jgi:hypothetical protein
MSKALSKSAKRIRLPKALMARLRVAGGPRRSHAKQRWRRRQSFGRADAIDRDANTGGLQNQISAFAGRRGESLDAVSAKYACFAAEEEANCLAAARRIVIIVTTGIFDPARSFREVRGARSPPRRTPAFFPPHFLAAVMPARFFQFHKSLMAGRSLPAAGAIGLRASLLDVDFFNFPFTRLTDGQKTQADAF